ncbi:MFS transporter [Metabacillus halosaccharovorans]|uniref:MFS transporter n=1 Tax=Metabacillus halosaccharovorans TaxID=930124 RepID=UPI001C1F24D5|nr:MFS transporter [Metabacillus halosaccharovorans]MBU7595754.1 glucuronide permease [Metabacillus halosaccharovorans]
MEKKDISKEQSKIEKAEYNKDFNRASLWQLIAYPASIFGHNTFMMLMIFVSYYAAGIVGLGTVVASVVLTGSRVFDAITDPIVGFFIDRTKGKFGKIRPFLLAGYVIMSIVTIVMYFTAHLVPEGMRLVYFIFLYVLYILGYTFSGVSQNAGMSILTNDPKQRPVIGGVGAVYKIILTSLLTMYLSLYLAPKHGGFNNVSFFQEFVITAVLIAAIGYALPIMAIWSKDRIQNFGIDAKDSQKISLKDIWPILKGNRPLQLFILSAASDKLALQTHGNQVIPVMLYGIIIGNYAMHGQMSMPSMVINLIMLFFGIGYARKAGTKKGYVFAVWGCIITYACLFLLLWLGDPTQIGFDNWGFMTIAFVGLMLLSGAFIFLASGLTQPMLPDITDYEVIRSGRFVPGVIATTFSFVDKAVSSLSQTIVGLTMAAIGFKAAFPDIDTPYSESIFWAAMFLWGGTVMIGWIISIIAMKFYPLTMERMEEIQEEINARRAKEEDHSIDIDASKTV